MKKNIFGLCCIILLLGNIFISKSYAYDKNDHKFQIDYTLHNGYTSSTAEGDLYWVPGSDSDSRCIILQNEEFNEKMCGYSDSTWTYSKFLCLFRYKGGFGADGVTGNDILKNGSPIISSEWFQEKFGSNISNIECVAIATDYVYNYGDGYIMHANIDDYKVNGVSTDSVQFVTNIEDLKKYLIDGDDSVVKTGDPEEPLPSDILDNSLPVPQQVSLNTGDTTGVTNESNEIFRYGGIFLKWINPQMASFDAYDNIKIEVKYKPKVKARSQVLRINKGIFTTTDFYDVVFDAFYHDNMVNNYYSYGLPTTNVLDLGWGYGLDMFGGYRFVDNDFNKAYNEISNTNNLGNFICDMIKGTQVSIRYVAEYQGNLYSSYWVDVGYGGSSLAPSSVSFSNASGEPIQPDDVDYTPSDQNISPDGDDASNSSLLDRLRNALFNIGQLPDDLNNIANEGSSFAKFLAKVWKEFPEIYIIFIGGLIIAIILRILGR